MRLVRPICAFALCCAWGIAVSNSARAVETAPESPSPEHIEFFEKKIRPVLVEKCYSCHSAGSKILRGGLYLDTRAGILNGGDSGPAVELGKPADSLLIQALKYDGYEMPPSGKLPAAVIADFEEWVKLGLPDPRVGGTFAKKAGIDVEKGRSFWAFRPIAQPMPPAVKNAAWPVDPLDRFVLSKLEEKKLHPAVDADPSARRNEPTPGARRPAPRSPSHACLLYTSDAADE